MKYMKYEHPPHAPMIPSLTSYPHKILGFIPRVPHPTMPNTKEFPPCLCYQQSWRCYTSAAEFLTVPPLIYVASHNTIYETSSVGGPDIHVFLGEIMWEKWPPTDQKNPGEQKTRLPPWPLSETSLKPPKKCMFQRKIIHKPPKPMVSVGFFGFRGHWSVGSFSPLTLRHPNHAAAPNAATLAGIQMKDMCLT